VSVRLFKEEEIRDLLSFPEAIAAVETAFGDLAAGRAVMPGVINLDLEDVRGEVHIKSAYLRGRENYVIKVASGFYRNPARGLPVGNGLMLLFEAETGLLRCILFDNGFITEMRTAAAGAVSAKYLARDPVETVGLVGSGTQARYQLRALLEVRSVGEVRVWSPHPDHVRDYVAEMSALFPHIRLRAVASCEQAVRGSDIVVTATPSRAPLVRADWVSPGTHITALGSDGPDKQELEVGVLKIADRIFCDSTSQCEKLGEVHHGLAAGAITRQSITGELGEIILGRRAGRESDAEITIADLTGLGVQDAAAAALVFEKGLVRNLGELIEL
jgi:ectoine utilization protein EutC